MADGKDDQLTYKQEKFVLAYIGEARGNAAKAAIIAGYSEKNAAQIGYQLQKTPSIRARIDDYLESFTVRSQHVLAELTDIAMSEWRDHIEVLERDDDGTPIRVKMDLGSKVKSLELLGKYYQLFADRQIVEGEMVQRVYVGMDPDDFDAEEAE